MYADFVMQDPVFFDLAARAKFRVTGTDRFRFLNGQITNDLRKTSETVAIEACVLNAKGKLNAHISISALGESLLIDAEPELRSDPRFKLYPEWMQQQTAQICLSRAGQPRRARRVPHKGHTTRGSLHGCTHKTHRHSATTPQLCYTDCVSLRGQEM